MCRSDLDARFCDDYRELFLLFYFFYFRHLLCFFYYILIFSCFYFRYIIHFVSCSNIHYPNDIQFHYLYYFLFFLE